MVRAVNVYLLGRDGVGWSIDRDRAHTARALVASGHRLVGNPLRADVVYCVWWNLLAARRYRPLRFKRVAAVVTNDLSYQVEDFERVRGVVDVWVVANSGQRRFLTEHGVAEAAIHDCPFYVEEDVFAPRRATREELARAAGVPYEQVRDRFLVGSFQRDSLGADLTQPKWQKNPELLLDVVAGVRSEDVLLLLAGPRRHYVIEACRERSIPYLFVGPEPAERDDIDTNTLALSTIASLWHLIDLYVVPSKAEGGPKSLLEAGLTETPIISTPVGMAPDLLPESLLFRDADEGTSLLRGVMAGEQDYGAFYARVQEVNRFDAFRSRVAAAAAGAATEAAAA
jgi:glycosyltransferase involved in cell wall biosynthesis